LKNLQMPLGTLTSLQYGPQTPCRVLHHLCYT
jgi:hypothetical protein